jgi:uncharacterized membrane protein YkvA (DUF1232 family)
VVGQLDDAVLVVLALRWIARKSGRDALEHHWPGPQGSLAVLLRLAGVATRA